MFAHFLTLCEVEKREVLPFLILSSSGDADRCEQRLCKSDTFDWFANVCFSSMLLKQHGGGSLPLCGGKLIIHYSQ